MRAAHSLAAATAAAILALVLTGCEEMPKGGGRPDPKPAPDPEPTSERCDAHPDWYIDKPIARVSPSGQMNPPTVTDPDTGEIDADWSALEAVVDEYEGKIFTLETFEALQKALFATGLYQKDERKWGIESVARPSVPRQGFSDPTRTMNGCPGVRLDMDGREYLPQEVWKRPLRLTE